MSAIIRHGKVEEAVLRELEDDLVKRWNHEQRQIAKRKRAKSFNDKNIVYIRTNLNKNTDADILEHLNNLTTSRAAYIKQLIRDDMKRYN
jgi:hypothetical protein